MIEIDKDLISSTIEESGFSDYCWLDPRTDIIVSEWVRFRCRFGCAEYGKTGSCPPAVPSIEICRKMIQEYGTGVMFHFAIKGEADASFHRMLMNRLWELERTIFMSGYYKVFLLQYGACNFCKICVAGDNRKECVHKEHCRPGAEAMGIDINLTAGKLGYTVKVAGTAESIADRFAFLLIA